MASRSGVELGTAYLTLAAETSSLLSDLGKSLAKGEQLAAKSGKRMGQNIREGIDASKPLDTEKLTQKVEADQKRLAASVEVYSRKQEDATRKVEIAHQRLKEVREKSTSTTSQVMRAEEQFRQAINRSKDVASQARAQQELYARAVSDSKEELFQAEQHNRRLAKSIEEAENKYKGFGGAVRKAMDEARNAMKGSFGGAFTKAETEGRNAAKGVATEFEKSADKSSKGFGDKFSFAFKGLIGVAAGAGASIGASLTKGITDNLAQGDIKAKMGASLGIAGDSAANAGKVTGELFKQGFGQSYDDVAHSVSAVISSIPGIANEKELQGITKNILSMSDAMGIDAVESAGALTTMLSSGLAKNGTEASQMLMTGLQHIPEQFRGEAIDALVEYSDEFVALGYTGDEAMTMLVRGAQKGQYGIDKTGDSIKEFQIRATDGSKTTADAFSTIGLNATDMSNKILAGGDSAKDARNQIVNALLGVKDPSQQAQAALALFGTPLEDMNVTQIPQFLRSMQNAEGGLGDFQGTAQKMTDQLQGSDANKLESFKRTISQGWADAVGGLVSAMVTVAEAVAPVRQFLIDTSDKWGPFAAGLGIVSAAAGLWAAKATIAAAATWLLKGAIAVLTSPITWTIVAIGLLVGAVIYAYKNFEWFRNGVNAVWDWIKGVIAGFVDWWTQVAWPGMQSGLEWLGDKFVWLYQNIIQPVWTWISDVISGFVNWLTTVAIPWVSNALQTLGGWFSWLNDTIIQPVWLSIRIMAAATVAILMTIFQGLSWLVTNVLAPPFRWLWENVINPVFTWISQKIGAFGTWFSTVALPMITGAIDWLKNAFHWLWDKVSAVFTWIWNKGYAFGQWLALTLTPYISASIDIVKAVFHWLWDKVSAVFSWISGKINAFAVWFNTYIAPFIGRVIDNVKAEFQWLWDKVSAVFTWVSNKINTFVVWFNTYIAPFIARVINNVKAEFQWLWDKVSAVWSWISDKISRTWNWVRDVVLAPAINWLKSVLGPAWDWVSGKIGKVWDWIGDKISRTWNWIRDVVLNPMRDFLQKDVVNAFAKAKDGIGDVWAKIQEKVKEPVRVVVETVINGGFIKNYNRIAEKFNVSPLPDVKLPPGFATGGIIPGYARGGILPGYQSKKKDELLTPMRKGEGVLVPEAVRALGADFIHGVNGAANSGGIQRARSWAESQGLIRRPREKGIAAGPGTSIYGGAMHSFSNPLQHQIARMGQLSIGNGGVSGKWKLDSAAAAWNGMSGVKLTKNRQPGVPHLTALPASNVWWAGYYNGGNDIQLNESQGFASAKSNRLVTIHEIGHALGLGHTMGLGIKSIMDYGSMYTLNGPSNADAKALQAIYPGGSGQGYTGNGDDVLSIAEAVKAAFKAIVNVPVDAALGGFRLAFPNNHFVQIGTAAVQKTIDDAINFITSFGDGGEESSGDVSGSAKEWMTKALKMKGLLSDSNLESGVRRLMQESGGNARAINNWDVNALVGNQSRGVMQVVPTTFQAFKEPGHGDIWNPVDNILASINYTLKTYGSLRAGWDRAGGYALGGIVGDKPALRFDGGGWLPQGRHIIEHNPRKPDAVLSNNDWQTMRKIAENANQRQSQGTKINITVPEREGIDPATMGRRMGEALSFRLMEAGI
ncbi:phage tail tape measure protein [Rothia sp. LK2588]|uniref:phage tail tape measure protein n=1 Tax=Rothia sp. LK2588 TaxID=3114369 RepID=UPI0034CE8231